MPKQPKVKANMTKHLTAKEREKIEKNEQRLKREKVHLKMPKLVADDETAAKCWNKIVKDMQGIELLDDVDASLLALLCLLYARIENLYATYYTLDVLSEARLEVEKQISRNETNFAAIADKLGLTPNGRARLAKKKEIPEEDPGSDLFG